ncbi:MAG: glycosyltransferase family 4 protein [Patescibacteria group bacterium]
MKILWLTWKDKKHPQAGGAETVNEELAKRLAVDGHEVIFLVGGFSGGVREETRDGFKVIRLGNRWTVYWQAYWYYKKNLKGWADLVIDEVNTIPFLAKFYVKEKNIIFIHQLCREIWFYQLWFPLSLIGYLTEPLYLRLLSDHPVITVSNSTKNDLLRFGFRSKNIQIISEGIELEPVEDLASIKKYDRPTLLSLGSIRPMKRTLDILRAFELAKQEIKDLRLIVAGAAEGRYGRKFLRAVARSAFKDDIEYLGPVDRIKKTEILQRSHLLLVTSVKEGWGLVVTEAASQGTPAIVYNVDGLRDSVKDGETGLICKEGRKDLLVRGLSMALINRDLYHKLRTQARDFSRQASQVKSYDGFKKILAEFYG